ncbi:MAG TPA: flagellar FlbD family protein [Bryobacteraceae bacterium]|nr:flagellar FlbD family protein [Bryobacteraceae bacterium]
MIRLTRINRVPLVLNADLIEHIETTPDTVIAMTNGQKFMVMESADQVIEKVIEFRRAIARRPEVFAERGSQISEQEDEQS